MSTYSKTGKPCCGYVNSLDDIRCLALYLQVPTFLAAAIRNTLAEVGTVSGGLCNFCHAKYCGAIQPATDHVNRGCFSGALTCSQ
jgi:hypothetical protein